MTSMQARKQRKAFYQAPVHKKRKWMASHLEESLLLKYDRRSLPIVKGDTVRVMRGNFKGHEDKVASVHVKRQKIEIEGLTMAKADGTKIPRPMHSSNVLITKLNLTDQWRRKLLERGVSEETKKAIEQEAAQQIKEQEAEEKRQAAEQKKQEEEAAKEAEESEEPQKTPETPKKPEEKKEQPTKETKAKPKQPQKKETPKKTETVKKPETKKKTTTTTKKPSSKSSTKKTTTKSSTAAKKTPKKKPSTKEETS